MSLPYFYEPFITQPHYTLSEETGKHCIQVLRMKENEQLNLTDGKGNLYIAVITKANKKNCEVKIEKTKVISNLYKYFYRNIIIKKSNAA